MEKNNLSNVKFCKIVHITTRNFANIMTNRKNLDENSVLKIASYLEMDKEDLFEKYKNCLFFA